LFLAVREYHCEQLEVRACSSVQLLTVTQLMIAHSSTHVPPTVHNDIRIQKGTRKPRSAPLNAQLDKNRSLQLVPYLHTLRSDLKNRTKIVDYHIGTRVSLSAFTTLQELLEV